MRIEELAQLAGVEFFDYQVAAIQEVLGTAAASRECLYYRTGAGKTITGLAMMKAQGRDEVLVITPPATYDAWEKWGTRFEIDVRCTSHAMFRKPGFKVTRDQAIIADEFHLFGGQKGKGWAKFDRMARGVTAPLIIMSATPNYNDAERVYCIKHVLDPHGTKGGFLAFLHQHCNTMPNPFGQQPLVDEDKPFIHYKDAAEFLSSLPNVHYLPDDLVYTIQDRGIPLHLPDGFEDYGLNLRKDRVMASQIEERHARIDLSLICNNGTIRAPVWKELSPLIRRAKTPVLVFCQHSTVAEALDKTLATYKVRVGTVTGDTPAKKKAARIQAFRDGVLDVLIGTATLATGTDGLDKVCDTLIILDDTDDASLRRQLVGRIMPRGSDADATKKRVYRLVLQ